MADLEEWQLDSPKLYLNLESVHAGKGVSVGQGLKVVVGAGFSKTEERSLDCRGRRVGWGGVQAWAELVQT